jgi:phospholipid-binding lipoprotein MlaA
MQNSLNFSRIMAAYLAYLACSSHAGQYEVAALAKVNGGLLAAGEPIMVIVDPPLREMVLERRTGGGQLRKARTRTMRSNFVRPALRVVSVSLGLALAACASGQQPGQEEDVYAINDPLESVNRSIFSFNMTLDEYVIKPTAQAYRDVLPEKVRDSIHNFFTNLRSPVILFNDAIQGEGKLAGDTFARLWLNTILGVGGLFDPATRAGIPFHDADFGQTFGIWGVGPGPYLVLPVLGPSNPRDAVGLVASWYADPANAIADDNDQGWVSYPRGAVEGIDLRARNIDILDRIQSTSLDFYATLRSLYNQRRAAEIRHEAPPEGAPGLTPGLTGMLVPDETAPANTPALAPATE